MIARYSSVGEYVRKAREVVKHPTREHYSGNGWDLGVSFEQACERGLVGDLDAAARATEALAKIETSSTRESYRLRPTLSMAGSRVSVPTYLAGKPNCMVRRVKTEIATRSVAIYVDTSCSAGIPASSMFQRGVTILALLSALQSSGVAIELYLVSSLYGRTDGDYYQLIQVESNPLDLSTSAFAIAHPAF